MVNLGLICLSLKKIKLCNSIVCNTFVEGFEFLLGLQTKGKKACPTCGPSLDDMALYLHSCNKMVYLHHTKYLPIDHP